MKHGRNARFGLAIVALVGVMIGVVSLVWGGDLGILKSDSAVPTIGNEPDESAEAVAPAVDVVASDSAAKETALDTIEGLPESRPQAQPASTSGSILAARRILTFYGHPYDWRMGILGQLSDDELVSALYRRAAMYEELSDRPVQPAIHIIATVAQDNPGSDGLYRARTDPEVIQHYADLAAENDMLLFVDVQVGRSTVQNEIAAVMPFLTQPHVHLALDPEFDMWGGDIPGDVIGTMTADEINYAQWVLSRIVAEQGGRNKILIVHQFTPDMVTGKGAIVDDPNVDLVTDMDGFGNWGLKVKHYNMFVRDELLEYAGIKLFFDQDTPLMPPEDVMSLEPVPNVIIYQ